MIRTVVIITAKPGLRDELLAAFKANAPTVREEKGCVEYVAHVDAPEVGPFQAKLGPDSFIIIESWESPEALKAHVGAPHMAAYAAKTKDLYASRAIHVLTAVA
jgi:quinol monooxygenase YgiN